MPTISVSGPSQLRRPPRRRLTEFRNQLLEFLFPSSSDNWLTVLRVGLGLEVVLYCVSLRRDWQYFFTGTDNGLINRNLLEAILSAQTPLVPRLGWLVAIGSHIGLREETVLYIAWIVLLSAGGFLVIGLSCRISAIVAWLLYLCAVKSGNLLTYGVDNFTTTGLFYLMMAPFPDRYSLDSRLWKAPPKDPHLSGFFRRVLQLHLCLIYFFGGLTKCLGTGWWTGESMWRALTRLPFNALPTSVVASGRNFLPLIGIAVCLLEVGYPVFIWLKRTRLIWLIGIVCMHIAIGLTMGLYLFALIMIILNLAAFGPEYLFRETDRKNSLSTESTDSVAVPS